MIGDIRNNGLAAPPEPQIIVLYSQHPVVGSQRYTALLLGLFAATRLILAAVGIYGVVSFLVAQRRRELAVRIAVGASAKDVLWLVLKEGLQMAAVVVACCMPAWRASRVDPCMAFARGLKRSLISLLRSERQQHVARDRAIARIA